MEGLGLGVDDVNSNSILILEDDAEPIVDFQRAAAQITSRPTIKIWHDAPRMMAKMKVFLTEAMPVSSDHDLNYGRERKTILERVWRLPISWPNYRRLVR